MHPEGQPIFVTHRVGLDRKGPTSLVRGEGRLWMDGRGCEPAGVMGEECGGGERMKNPTSTVDAVDMDSNSAPTHNNRARS